MRKNNSKYLVKKVIIAADHAGVILKKNISQYLLKKGFIVNDVGTNNSDKSVDYPDFAKKLVRKMDKIGLDQMGQSKKHSICLMSVIGRSP